MYELDIYYIINSEVFAVFLSVKIGHEMFLPNKFEFYALFSFPEIIIKILIIHVATKIHSKISE